MQGVSGGSVMSVWTCPHCGATDMSGEPEHDFRCPYYDGPWPEDAMREASGLRNELTAMRAQLNAISDALIYLAERAAPMAICDDYRMERFPILKGLRETKSE